MGETHQLTSSPEIEWTTNQSGCASSCHGWFVGVLNGAHWWLYDMREPDKSNVALHLILTCEVSRNLILGVIPMKIISVLCVVFWVNMVAIGASPPLILTGGGVFQLTKGTDGTPIITQYDGVVIDWRNGGQNPPTGSLTERVATLTRAVGDPTTARAMAYLYGRIAEAYRDNTVLDPWTKAKDGIDGVLRISGAEARWAGWRASIAAELGGRGIRTTSPKQTQLDALLAISAGLTQGSTSAGLDNALEDAVGEKAINWERLFELIKFIIEFLKLLKPTG